MPRQTGGTIEAEHNVHVLDTGQGATLADAVEHIEHHDPVPVRIDTQHEPYRLCMV